MSAEFPRNRGITAGTAGSLPGIDHLGIADLLMLKSFPHIAGSRSMSQCQSEPELHELLLSDESAGSASEGEALAAGGQSSQSGQPGQPGEPGEPGQPSRTAQPDQAAELEWDSESEEPDLDNTNATVLDFPWYEWAAARRAQFGLRHGPLVAMTLCCGTDTAAHALKDLLGHDNVRVHLAVDHNDAAKRFTLLNSQPTHFYEEMQHLNDAGGAYCAVCGDGCEAARSSCDICVATSLVCLEETPNANASFKREFQRPPTLAPV